MAVSTSTVVKFYTKENEFLKKYDLDDRSDDYIYDGLVCNGGATFNPEKYGNFSEEQKEIMKVYFNEESLSVMEGYAEEVIVNIQSPEKLLPIWSKIKSSVAKSFQANLIEYHNGIIADHEKVTSEIARYNSKKEDIILPEFTKLKSEYDFKNDLWRITSAIESISKVIGLLMVAEENNFLVEITANDC